MGSRVKRSGFSFIEVLVCVALIGLLAAVAVPRLVRVQNAADVAQAKSDMATLKSGLEAYKVDLGMYPRMNRFASARVVYHGNGDTFTLERLTTPIAYVGASTNYVDPFQANARYRGADLESLSGDPGFTTAYRDYRYNARNLIDTSLWGETNYWDVNPLWYFLESSGPDRHFNEVNLVLNSMTADTPENRALLYKTIYDPTNGAMSRGSIWVAGGDPQGTGTLMADLVRAASGVGGWARYGE